MGQSTKKKKIIALSCGTKNGNCETYIKAAAMGAEEFGVETEIIRAMELKVLPCRGCGGCSPKGQPFHTGKCILKDDVEWILQKTIVEDAALIMGVPCYHLRANGYFMCISDRMLPFFRRDPSVLNKTRVGAIIAVGGSGYDAWASLTLPTVNVFMQHTRILVDQMLVTNAGYKEWNLWMQQGNKTLTSHTHMARVEDLEWDRVLEMWPDQEEPLEFRKKALARAKELGRNVARAMDLPPEKVKYKGEEAGVVCPVCHCNTLVVPENLPYVYCPICAVRGVVIVDKDKMKVVWNKEDAKNPRFTPVHTDHHFSMSGKTLEKRMRDAPAIEELLKGYRSYGNIIKPPEKE
jgi:multimeric flavodoxin WrbA